MNTSKKWRKPLFRQPKGTGFPVPFHMLGILAFLNRQVLRARKGKETEILWLGRENKGALPFHVAVPMGDFHLPVGVARIASYGFFIAFFI